MTIETLDDTGFSFTQVGFQSRRFSADMGDGYWLGARRGNPQGVRAWAIRISALPEIAAYTISHNGVPKTRARYLHDFWAAHTLENDSEIFRLRDPFPRDPGAPYVFAKFKENSMEWGVFSEAVFSLDSLTIIEARLPYLNPNDLNDQVV